MIILDNRNYEIEYSEMALFRESLTYYLKDIQKSIENVDYLLALAKEKLEEIESKEEYVPTDYDEKFYFYNGDVSDFVEVVLNRIKELEGNKKYYAKRIDEAKKTLSTLEEFRNL